MNKYIITLVITLGFTSYILYSKYRDEKEAHEYAESVIIKMEEIEKKNQQLEQELNNVKDKPSQDWLNTTIPSNIKLLIKQRIE